MTPSKTTTAARPASLSDSSWSPPSSSSSSPASSATPCNNLRDRRLFVVLPFRAAAAADQRAQRRRLLTEETWVVQNRQHHSHRHHEEEEVDGIVVASSAVPAPRASSSFSIPAGRRRRRTWSRTDNQDAVQMADVDPLGIPENDDGPLKDEPEPVPSKGGSDPDNDDGSADADDHASSAASSSNDVSTISNVSQHHVMWTPSPPQSPPALVIATTAAQPFPTNGEGEAPFLTAMGDAAAKPQRRQQPSPPTLPLRVPREICLPTAVADRIAASEVPEWLRISRRTSERLGRRRTPQSVDEDGQLERSPNSGEIANDNEESDTSLPPPPPPMDHPSLPTPPIPFFTVRRLAPLVTTEPSPSIPRPTLGKHCQSAPASSVRYPTIRPLPKTTTPPRRPESLHYWSSARRLRSTATAAAATSGHEQLNGIIHDRSLSFSPGSASPGGGHAPSYSACPSPSSSQLSAADRKLLGTRERYNNYSSSGRHLRQQPPGSNRSVATLSVGSLVGQSSWASAPGMAYEEAAAAVTAAAATVTSSSCYSAASSSGGGVPGLLPTACASHSHTTVTTVSATAATMTAIGTATTSISAATLCPTVPEAPERNSVENDDEEETCGILPSSSVDEHPLRERERRQRRRRRMARFGCRGANSDAASRGLLDRGVAWAASALRHHRAKDDEDNNDPPARLPSRRRNANKRARGRGHSCRNDPPHLQRSSGCLT